MPCRSRSSSPGFSKIWLAMSAGQHDKHSASPLPVAVLTRDISSCILARKHIINSCLSQLSETYTLSGKIKFLPFKFRKDLEELLHKAYELIGQFFLILWDHIPSFLQKHQTNVCRYRDVWFSSAKSSSYRLLNPENTAEICPAEFINYWDSCSRGPAERLRIKKSGYFRVEAF